MFGTGSWRIFLAGALCGTILTGGVAATLVWWKPHQRRSDEDEAIYDQCLVRQAGNTAACDALMRALERERVAETAMQKEAAKMLATGSSKREVVDWAMKKGFVGRQLSDAVGISLEDLQHNKY
jgi:hypothetical protein